MVEGGCVCTARATKVLEERGKVSWLRGCQDLTRDHVEQLADHMQESPPSGVEKKFSLLPAKEFQDVRVVQGIQGVQGI